MRKLLYPIAYLTVVVLGCTAGWFVYHSTSIQFLESLRMRTQSMATLIDAPSFGSLTLSESDLATSSYQVLKRQMVELKSHNDDMRFVYLMAFKGDTVYFVVDSEDVSSPDYSPPGQIYDEATPFLKQSFAQGLPSFYEEDSDRWGYWISIFAPIPSSRSDVRFFLGADVDAEKFYVLLYGQMGLVLFSTILLIGLLLSLQRSHGREHELEQMRADFVAIASHELRSPLTAVRWSLAELRTRPTLSPDAREIVNDLYERICALIARTSTFLQTAAADHGVMDKSAFTICNISLIVKESIAHAQSIGRVKGITVHSDDSLESAMSIKADAARLRLVFDNLLSNAVKYSPQNSAVRVYCSQDTSTKTFFIQDQGIGIPKSELKQVFKGFHRASNAKRSGAIGSGFGLYMAKKIVEFHGGTLTCESEIGKGTVFAVTLPSGT